ncbi:MAG: hypothetical protein CXX72_04805 [Methanobacteriota archaeon]|nr:MAG: hypothetical protein CXX72_04805 [Euryarchaeota archaeon]
MAVRAGASVRDLEFVQFHPTALALAGDRPFLITEALRGDGAVLMTEEEHRRWTQTDRTVPPATLSFMLKHHANGSLATRDIVARACDSEMKRSGDAHVLLVTEHLDGEELAERFPTIAQRLQRHGLELGRDPLPVAPAAHYLVGGLAVNEWGEVWQRDMAADDPTNTAWATCSQGCTRSARYPAPVCMEPIDWLRTRCSKRSSSAIGRAHGSWRP